MSHNHHSHGSDVSGQVLLWAVGLNLLLTVAEVLAGIYAGSLALLADALHNFNDCAALLIAYVARLIGRRGRDEGYTFGYQRAELIGAMINLTTLVVVGLYLLYESVARFIYPQEIDGMWVMIAAGVAVVVDVATAWLLWAMSRGSLNVKAAFIHNLTDAGASIAVLIGGLAITLWGITIVDPLLTAVIAGYILWTSLFLMRRTARLLMEATPEDIRIEDLRRMADEIDGVRELHHIHVWELDEQRRAFEGHVVIARDDASRLDRIKREVKALLHDRFRIEHSMLEFEFSDDPCPDECGHSHQTPNIPTKETTHD